MCDHLRRFNIHKQVHGRISASSHLLKCFTLEEFWHMAYNITYNIFYLFLNRFWVLKVISQKLDLPDFRFKSAFYGFLKQAIFCLWFVKQRSMKHRLWTQTSTDYETHYFQNILGIGIIRTSQRSRKEVAELFVCTNDKWRLYVVHHTNCHPLVTNQT
jgi:hypothetical protein